MVAAEVEEVGDRIVDGQEALDLAQVPPHPAPEGPERDALVAELLDNTADILREADSLSPNG